MFGFRKTKPAPIKPAAALAAASFRYLNLGCGGRFHRGWVNVDIVSSDPARVVQHNILESLPFDDSTFDAVYHSHVLEHLPRAAAPRFLAECRRVLRPGGVLRIVVPDLETITRLYLENLAAAWAGDSTATPQHEWMTLELLDQLTREESGGEMLRHWKRDPMPAEEFVISRMGGEVLGILDKLRNPNARPPAPAPATPEEVGRFRASGEVHKWMYDRVSLRSLLTSLGFVDFRICGAGDSAIADWASFALDVMPDGQVRKPDSLFVEAVVPA